MKTVTVGIKANMSIIGMIVNIAVKKRKKKEIVGMTMMITTGK